MWPHRRQPTRFPSIPGILQAWTWEWVAISFSYAWKWRVKVDSLSHVQLLATPWTVAYQSPPSMGYSRQEYWCRVPLPSPSQWTLMTDFLSMDWLDLLAVQGTLKAFLQHQSPKVSVLQHSAFFIVQLSYLYMTTGKTIALTRQSFVSKVMSLLLNMLSRLVIAFLPRSKSLLISWLQLPSVVILEPPKIKSLTVSTVYPFICNEVMGPDAMILVFLMLSLKPIFTLTSFTFIKRIWGQWRREVLEVA